MMDGAGMDEFSSRMDATLKAWMSSFGTDGWMIRFANGMDSFGIRDENLAVSGWVSPWRDG